MGVAGGMKPLVSPAPAAGACPPETQDAGLAAIDAQPCAGAAINALGTGTCDAMKLDGTTLTACTRPAQLEKNPDRHNIRAIVGNSCIEHCLTLPT